MTTEQIDAVARRVVELLRGERDRALRAALRGLAARVADVRELLADIEDHGQAMLLAAVTPPTRPVAPRPRAPAAPTAAPGSDGPDRSAGA